MKPTKEMYKRMDELIKEVCEKSEEMRGFNPADQYTIVSLFFDFYGDCYDLNSEMDRLTVLGLCMKKLLAPINELVRVVKHSMVVHDSKTCKLDIRQSRIDNGIDELMEKYIYEAAMMFAGKEEKQ